MKEAQAIDRMRQVIRRQHKALATEDAYVLWLRRYMRALRQMPLRLSSEKKLEKFLTDLALERDVSASTQNQAFNALVFFYKVVLGQPLGDVNALRAHRPVHERHAPTPAETSALLQTVPNQGGYATNLVSRMLYGCGLRVSEPLNLRIKDIDLERRRFCIRGAKGGKDRVVAIPLTLISELTQQMQLARVVWERDQQNGTPVMLPHALASKYPEYQFSWGWAWLFPAHNTCRDPRSGRIVRYRMHEVNVQRAIKQARHQLGICVLPHELRHHSECRIIPSRASKISKSPRVFSLLRFCSRNNQRPCRNANSLSLGLKRPGRPFNGSVFANACSLSSRFAWK
jgi:integrase